MEYTMIRQPIAIRCQLLKGSSIRFQNMIISPKAKTQTNVVAPKISKNRLLSDFCLSFILYGMKYY